jgi:hypothetical protein
MPQMGELILILRHATSKYHYSTCYGSWLGLDKMLKARRGSLVAHCFFFFRRFPSPLFQNTRGLLSPLLLNLTCLLRRSQVVRGSRSSEARHGQLPLMTARERYRLQHLGWTSQAVTPYPSTTCSRLKGPGLADLAE